MAGKSKYLLLLVLCMPGCSSITSGLLDSVNPMKEEKGINTTVQLGKENHNQESKQLVGVSSKEDYTNSTIGMVDNSINIPWWALVISLVVGILVRPIDFIKDWRKMK